MGIEYKVAELFTYLLHDFLDNSEKIFDCFNYSFFSFSLQGVICCER